jgi:predicted esterase
MRRLIPLTILTAVAALAFGGPAYAQKKGSASGMGQGEYVKVDISDKGDGWEGAYYSVFIPKGVVPGRTYPLIMSLHGNGGSAEKFAKNLAQVSTKELPCFVVSPEYQAERKFNGKMYPRCGEIFKTALDAVLAKYPIDESRLVLQGFYMGGNYLASWTYAWMAKDPATYPFDMVWCSSTAIPPRDKGKYGARQEAPKIPWLLFTGSKETAVKGVVNVVKGTRHAYRVFHARGIDARYIEIAGMGHSVNHRCKEIMRASLLELTSFAGAVKKTKKLPEAAEPALALASNGKFAEALAALEALRATESALTSTEKGKVASQVKGIEKFLKSHASSQPKQIAAGFTPSNYDAFLALAEALKDHKTLGKSYAKAVEKMQKNKIVKAQLKARDEFTAAGKIADAAASLSAMEKLANGKLKMTLFGARAAAHILAMSDEYDG